MNKKLYVGGLPFSVTEEQLKTLFESHGTVDSAKVVTDRYTDRSRGFGFVEMSTEQEAEQAIQALNGTELEGRSLTVNESRPREDRSGGGSRNRWYQYNMIPQQVMYFYADIWIMPCQYRSSCSTKNPG